MEQQEAHLARWIYQLSGSQAATLAVSRIAYRAAMLAIAVAAAPTGEAAQATSVIDIGLPRVSSYSPVGASASGEFVAVTGTVWQAPVIWSLSNGAIEIDSPVGYQGHVMAMSRDTAVAVGSVFNGVDSRAGVWDSSGNYRDLGLLTGVGHSAEDISADGSTIVIRAWPRSSTNSGYREVFTWNATRGLQRLGSIQGGGVSVTAMSDDGSVLAGVESNGPVETRLFRWTAATGMRELGMSSIYFFGSSPPRMSADGSVVMGVVSGSPGFSLFRWTEVSGSQAGNFQEIRLPQQVIVDGLYLSADGSTLVGGLDGQHRGWFRWTEAGGYEIHPEDLPVHVAGISEDASVVALVKFNDPDTFGRTESYRWSEAEGEVRLSPLRVEEGSRCDARGVSADGSMIYGVQDVGSHQRVVVWPTDGVIGLSECGPAVPNSTGVPASIDAFGSNAVALGDLVLQASDLPPSAPAYLLVARTIRPTFPFGTSMGRLCLEPPVGRFDRPGQIGAADSAGQFSLRIDPAVLAGTAGPFAPLWGESWSFQAWYRDGNPGPTSNFTNATTIRFR